MTAATARAERRGLRRRRARGGRGAARALRADAAAAQRLPVGQARRRRLAEARGPEPGPLLQDPRRLQRHAQGAGGAAPGRRRFVCASAGNHAQGMAFACRHFGVEGVVFMPVTTPQQKIDKTRQFGGGRVEIRLVGDYFDATLAAAQAFAAEAGALFLPPFDDADVIEGQATVRARDPRAVRPAPRTSSSSRSAAAGSPRAWSRVAAALAPRDRGRASSSRAGGAEPAAGARGGRAGDAAARSTTSSTAPRWRGSATCNFAVLRALRARRACVARAGGPRLRHHGRDAERRGHGARAGRRARHRRAARPRASPGGRVVAVVSGSNFDFERLPDVKERALRWEGRKKYYILRLPQRRRARCASSCRSLGPEDDIVALRVPEEVRRATSARSLLGIETRGAREFRRRWRRGMAAAGFTWLDITDDAVITSLII